MKVINEKGRLFGKINVIDFLVLIFLLCLMPMVYFGYQFLTKKPLEPEKKEFIEIELDCQLIKLSPQDLKSISVGDRELDENQQVIGEIISIGQSEPYKYEFDIGGGEKIIKQDLVLKQLEAKLKLKTYIIGNGDLHYKGRKILANSPIEFKTSKYTIGAILHKEGASLRERLELNIILKDLNEETINLISVGDKEIDKNGNTIAEIIELGKIEVSYFEVDLGKGSYTAGENIGKKQLSVKMGLLCQIRDKNQLYFKNMRIEGDNQFEFNTDKYKVIAKVAKTFERISPVIEKWIRLQVKFYGVIPELTSLIKNGDVEKDPYNNVVATINSVIFNRLSQVLTIKNDKFITLHHPFNRDILIILDVLCLNKEGIFYFHNYPIKIGNNITFTTDLYSLTGEIGGMEIK